MKHVIGTAVLAAGIAFAAPAFADTMSATYGNTVTVTNAEGAVINYYMNEDGSFSMSAGETMAEGTWRIDGDNICLTVGGEETCSPLDNSRSVGDTWEAQDADGNTITLSIVAGRQ